MTPSLSNRSPFLVGVAFALIIVWSNAFAQTPSDDTLEDRIAYRLEVNNTLRRYDVKVDVKDRVATLDGEVATAAQKAEAARIANIDNIARVENNITVSPTADQTVADRVKAGLSKTGAKIDDAWITTKVKWFVMRDDLLDKSDINVDTNSKVVTLKGSVPSNAARERANVLARNTEGVTRVVDQLMVAPAPSGATQK